MAYQRRERTLASSTRHTYMMRMSIADTLTMRVNRITRGLLQHGAPSRMH
jgi:hypothetical protein